MGCRDDVKEERHVHAAHLHMCTHTRANGLTYRRALAFTCMHTCICKHTYTCIHYKAVDTSENIIKLNLNKCFRKLIKYNMRPQNVNFYKKMSTRG